MHIALKKIKYELERFLPRGSEEQIEDIYEVAKLAFYETPKGKKELEKLEKLKEKAKQKSIKIENKVVANEKVINNITEKLNRVADNSETLKNK